MDAENLLNDARAWIVEDLTADVCNLPHVSGQHDDEYDDEDFYLDFRVYLRPDGSVDLDVGAPDYDLDHRGHCGSGVVHAHDSEEHIATAVDDAIAQILDAIAAA